jgi:sulfite reductase alpha subunit-like flavoprotein
VQVRAEPLDVQARRRRLAADQWASHASSIPAGPHAQTSRSRQSGTSVEVAGEVEHAVGVGVQLDQAHQPAAASSRSSEAKMTSRVVGAEWIMHDVGQLARRGCAASP